MAKKVDEYGNEYEDWDDHLDQPAVTPPARTAEAPEKAPPRPATVDPLAGYNAQEQDFLRRNQNQDGSYDFHRVKAALSNDTSSRNYDSQGPAYNNTPTLQPGYGGAAGGSGSSGSNDQRSYTTPTAAAAYTQYLAPAPVPVAAPVAAPVAPPAPDPMIAKLVAQLEAQRAAQEAEQARIREIVMSQLGDATAPVDINSPTLKGIIDPQKVALQRSAGRQRSAAAERAAYKGLGDSGALDTRINQIEQGRGESEAAMIGQILQSELQNKRAQAAQLMDLAVRSGDAASARTLQAQLQTLDQQMAQNRFSADLGFRQSSFDTNAGFQQQGLDFQRYAFDEGEDSQRYRFDNDLAYRLAQLQLQGNAGSMGFLGGLL